MTWIRLFGGTCSNSVASPVFKTPECCLAYLILSSAVFGVILCSRNFWNCCQSIGGPSRSLDMAGVKGSNPFRPIPLFSISILLILEGGILTRLSPRPQPLQPLRSLIAALQLLSSSPNSLNFFFNRQRILWLWHSLDEKHEEQFKRIVDASQNMMRNDEDMS